MGAANVDHEIATMRGRSLLPMNDESVSRNGGRLKSGSSVWGTSTPSFTRPPPLATPTTTTTTTTTRENVIIPDEEELDSDSLDGETGPRMLFHHRHDVLMLQKHSLRDRLKHFTWANFSTTMATGSLSVVLFNTPHQFAGLKTIGKVMFIIDLALFCTFCALITARFVLHPKALAKSLKHPVEAFFIGTFWVSVSLILQCSSDYGHYAGLSSWLTKSMEICFWIYAALTLIFSVAVYWTLFIKRRLQVPEMMPTWTLPIYPLLVTGPLAGVLLDHQPPAAGVPIFVAGVLFQGLGWMVTVFLYAIWTIRLFSADLPQPSKRPGMFIAVGPAAYTAQALVTLGNQVTEFLPDHFLGTTTVSTPQVLRVLGAISGMFLWLLAFWYFCIATLSVLKDVRKMKFDLSWWGFVFPNSGLALAAMQIGIMLDSEGIKWVTSVMTVMLFVMWVLVGVGHGRAVWKGDIMWDGKDEDA